MAYVATTLTLAPIQALLLVIVPSAARAFPRFYHRLCASLIGLKIIVRGEPLVGRPVLVVANHLSYLDITVLGSIVRGSFIAKEEVRGWPFFGWIARLQQTVFVARHADGRSADRQRAIVSNRLIQGDSLILFAEGTSSDGARVLPLKPSLIAAAAKPPSNTRNEAQLKMIPVQPVTIAVTQLDGMPIGRFMRSAYAWYGDMSLVPHLWRHFGLGRVTVEVTFHPALGMSEVRQRKALAQYCRDRIAAGLVASNSGREDYLDTQSRAARLLPSA